MSGCGCLCLRSLPPRHCLKRSVRLCWSDVLCPLLDLSVCPPTARPLTHSLSDVVYPLLDLSVCSPQTDLCWTRAPRLTVCQMWCIHCWICLSVRHNQTFVGRGHSVSQFVRCSVPTAGSVCLFATTRPLLDEGTQTHS